MTNDESLSDVVGKRVREVRGRRGWSVDRLAARCAEVGAPQLTVDALYLVEGGRREAATGRRRRRITVDELVALGLAFDMAPVFLLLPFENVEYQLTPEVRALASDAYQWLIGGAPYRGSSDGATAGLPGDDPAAPPHPGENPLATYMNERPAYAPLFRTSRETSSRDETPEMLALLRAIAEKLGVATEIDTKEGSEHGDETD